MNYNIINNAKANRFEVTINGITAYLEYEYFEGGIDLMYTVVPEKLGGKGVGSALVEYAFQLAAENEMKVKVSCPFVKKYKEKHTEKYI